MLAFVCLVKERHNSVSKRYLSRGEVLNTSHNADKIRKCLALSEKHLDNVTATQSIGTTSDGKCWDCSVIPTFWGVL